MKCDGLSSFKGRINILCKLIDPGHTQLAVYLLNNEKQYKNMEFTRVLYVSIFHNNFLFVLYLTKYKGINVYIFGIQMDFFDQKL